RAADDRALGHAGPRRRRRHARATAQGLCRHLATAAPTYRTVREPAAGLARPPDAEAEDAGHRRAMNLGPQLLAEGLGTAFLLAIVVGSGIMGETLAGGNLAIALLANSLATGAGLIVLILACGPVSGAHFNPAVSLLMAVRGALP